MIVLAAAAIGILIFGAAALLGVLAAEMICARVTPSADGPQTHTPRPLLIVAGFAIVGALVEVNGFAVHGFAGSVIAVGALASFALAGCFYCDVARGMVPDFFTLFPLACLLIYAAIFGEWSILLAAAVPLIPFAIMALTSHGRGVGWGDVKLVALGGALLSLPTSLLAFALACLAAAVIPWLRGQRGVPIAFAPYLVVAIAATLALRP
jgi:prepilin signal peptidase PulO-like enzyme (type II secretory pathway)